MRASINNFDEADPIEISNNVEMLKTVINATRLPTPKKAMTLLILMITVTQINKSNRITNLPLSTNLEGPLNKTS